MSKSALSNKSIREPNGWHDMPYGNSLKLAYEAQLQSIVQQCFGYHLVKFGELSKELSLKGCQIKHQLCQTRELSENSGVIASSTQLPYAEKSIDSFLLTHVLDFAKDPHQILREVDHCLIPNGRLIIIGFNPYSCAGAARYLPIKRNNIIHQARCFSRSRVRDWLSLLGYEINEEKRFLFSDFLFGKEVRRPRPWHSIVQRNLSFFASVYVIVGKKREFPLSLIKPRWKPVPKFSPVGASMRIIREDICKKV